MTLTTFLFLLGRVVVIVRTSSVGSCQDVRSRGTVIGATMERYAILRKLGQGTYGSVYLCGKPTPD